MTQSALVVGSGAIGLRTAVELLKRNVKIILHSTKHPTDSSVCSMGAGGLWMPFKCEDIRVHKWGIETLDELINIMEKGDKTSKLVERVPAIYLRKRNEYTEKTLPEWTKDKRLGFDHMNIEMLEWQNSVLKLKIPFSDYAELVKHGYSYCWMFQAPIVDCPKMLQNMLEQVEAHPLTQEVTLEIDKPYRSIDEMVHAAKSLNCDALVNCTGLASRKLCNDKSLYPGRGVLLQYDRNCARHPSLEVPKEDGSPMRDVWVMIEDPPYASDVDPVYMIPRGNIIAIGGTYYENDYEMHMRPQERERLLLNASLMGIDTSRAKPIGEWVGFRPCRPTVRLDLDQQYQSDVNDQIKIVHNYGHGGSGWTVYVGAAKAAADLLTLEKATEN